MHESAGVGKSRHWDSTPYCIQSFYLALRSGAGWSSVDPVCASELQARVAEGEFWLDEAEFMTQFDDVTVGYPITKEGHLKSIYTGNFLTLLKMVYYFQSPILTSSVAIFFYPDITPLWQDVC